MRRLQSGLTSKWRLAVDTRRRLLRLILIAGHKHDGPQAAALMNGSSAPHVIADRVSDAHAILDHIERAVGKRKRLRRIAIRQDPIPQNHPAASSFASISF